MSHNLQCVCVCQHLAHCENPPPSETDRMASHHQKKRPRKQHANTNERKEITDSESPYKDVFQIYRGELDAKHDKHERLVKLSRDCTIHSKRIIFLLHRISGETEENKVLAEAEEKLHEVLKILRAIASELVGEDPDKYHSAYTPGVQEFVEALTYFVFLKEGRLMSLEEVQDYLRFCEKAEGELEIDTGKTEVGEVKQESLRLQLNAIDFVLGVADLTGELMRMSVNAVGSGNNETPFDLLPFVRAVYCGINSLRPISRELPRKVNVLRSSLVKIEQVCYTLKIRGSEIPKHMLAHVIGTGPRTHETDSTEMYDSD